jgi:hypothetical protein
LLFPSNSSYLSAKMRETHFCRQVKKKCERGCANRPEPHKRAMVTRIKPLSKIMIYT